MLDHARYVARREPTTCGCHPSRNLVNPRCEVMELAGSQALPAANEGELSYAVLLLGGWRPPPQTLLERDLDMDEPRTDCSTMTDAELASAVWHHRREALHGNRHAFGRAHELEREVRKRAGPIRTVTAKLGDVRDGLKRPWWKLW